MVASPYLFVIARLSRFIRTLIKATFKLMRLGTMFGTPQYLSYELETGRDQKPYLPHPIHHLPPELLVEILYQHTPSRYEDIRERRKILALSHVCSHWRSVALSTPSLWTFIYVQCMESNVHRKLDCARAWLSRSLQLPLSIVLEMMDVKPSSVEAAFQALIPHCARWKEVSFPMLPLGPHILSLVKGNLPLLESAEFPWVQLTHVELDTYITPAVHDILASALNVVCLRVYLRDHVQGAEPQIITHPNISTLDVSGHGDDHAASCLMDHLVLPALRRLMLCKSWRSAIYLVARSACTPSSLNIAIFDKCDLIALLELCPTLQELAISLEWADESEVAVDALTFQGGI
ncbi:hypothetical protein FIBSPDRAFT_955889 [Athelia psychrophila]|uniref:F-box domain-containing protein n=1 Tax=Athelia psychrophila TaxID=1759441 RepID=A0A166HJJ6_9AGAM|nr:hypothetical protein FIBSPDRAFT_955889 [Fibularhizoctonia sp. CBS 109695]